MANATRTFKTYDRTSGSPLEATAITAANAAQFFDDDSIPTDKLADVADSIAGSSVNLTEDIVPTDLDSGVVGTAAPVAAVAGVPFNVVVDIDDGGTGNDVVTAVIPRKGLLVDANAIKRAADSRGLGGDKVHAFTAAAGAGTKVFESDLELPGPAALPDQTKSVTNRIDDSAAIFAAGASIFFGRTSGGGGGNNAARVVLTFLPLD